MTIKRRTVKFNDRISDFGNASFQHVEIFTDPPSPLGLVRYTIRGEKQALGLRIDFDKRCFLDIIDEEGQKTDDEAVRTKLNATARQIVDYLAAQERARKAEIERLAELAVNFAKQAKNQKKKISFNRRKFPKGK